MSDESRRKMAEDRIHELLNLNPDNDDDLERFDGDAIIKEVRHNPSLAAREYEFTDSSGPYQSYPLHQSIRLRATIDVIVALHHSYPHAVEAKYEEDDGRTALQLAVIYEAPTEVTLFLFHRWPEAVRLKDWDDFMPLHHACCHNAPVEVVTALMNRWPDATRKKNCYGATPLHCAIEPLYKNPSLEILSLLINQYPNALRVKDICGCTPLRYALHVEAPLEVILFLLEQYPDATLDRDNDGNSPLDYCNQQFQYSDDVLKVLSCIFKLCANTMDNDTSKEMMHFFHEIEWWNGAVFLLDRYPLVAKNLDIDDKVFPDLISMAGRRCSMKTVWKLIGNELDIIEGM